MCASQETKMTQAALNLPHAVAKHLTEKMPLLCGGIMGLTTPLLDLHQGSEERTLEPVEFGGICADIGPP